MPDFLFLTSPHWEDYELLDCGNGLKLERYGPYRFVRPESQALWQPLLPSSEWQKAHAIFQTRHSESGGVWSFNQEIKTPWEMRYQHLRFLAHTTASRHLGVFPEQASHWDWISEQIRHAPKPVRVLNLFGYTGLATLAAASTGAQVTHVDASKNAVRQGQQNQALSSLGDKAIRWLVDDAYKFVQREVRRHSQYEGIILDPPKFGRGPQGQVWELYTSLPALLKYCRALLSERALFIVLTVYAVRLSALSLHYALEEVTQGLGGSVTSGELILVEKSAQRHLSMAIFSRWTSSTQN